MVLSFSTVVDLELEPVHCCYYAYGRNCATVCMIHVCTYIHDMYTAVTAANVERLCVTIN